jgi:hypothetical protein
MDFLLGLTLLVTAVVTVAYWVDFFFSGTVQAVQDEAYLRFERAFPVADAWVAVCSVVAAVGLFTRSDYGTLFGLLAAGALVFLGLIDLTYNLENGMFRLLPGSVQMWVETVIIAWSLALGGFLAVYLGSRVV